jgi:hypothetical protein
MVLEVAYVLPTVAGRKLEESRLRALASTTVAMLRQKIAARPNVEV